MWFRLVLLPIVTGALLGSPVMAAPDQLTCTGPFARDTSHDRLVKEFGTRNVTFPTIDGPEGEKLKASVIYPNDEERRVEVIWWDEKGRRRPSTIRTLGKGWTGPHSMRVGLSTSEVEGINGKPFIVAGFEWDYGGTATDWKGGALSRVPGGCMLHVVFIPDDRAPEKALTAVAGDQQFLSSSRSFRAVNATVLRIGIGYPDRGQ